MRLSGLVGLVLVGVVVAGCAKPSSTPAPKDNNTPAPISVPSTPAPSPLPAGPCTPGASAVTLPSGPYGSGVTLRPPAPGATPERPWFGYLSATQMDAPTAFSSGGLFAAVFMRKGGTATVDAAEFMLNGFLSPAPSLAWFDTHVVLEGIQPSAHQFSPFGDYGNFDFRIPAGQAGDAFRLTIKDVLLDDGTSGDVAVTFCRQAPPKASVTLKADREWLPATAAAVIPPDSPLTVRIAFTHDMLAETVERSLTGEHDKSGGSQGDWITGLKWLDARTVELTADRTAPTMRLNLAAAQDQYGLFVPGGVPNLYSGEPPRVLAIDPVSGKETRLAEIPPEPNNPALSPDGQLLRVMSWQMRGGHDVPDAQFLLINLATGTAQPIKPEDQGWEPSSHILSIAREGLDSLTVVRPDGTTVIPGLPDMDSYLESPDGKWVAALLRRGAVVDYSYVPVQFVIVATDDVKNRKTLTGEATMFRPGKDGITLYGPVWSPDSTRIAFTQPTKDGASLVVADLAAGALRTLAPNLPGVRSSWDPVTWSPDGSKILAGSTLVDAATGQVLQRIDAGAGEPFWSKDGRWLLFGSMGWNQWSEMTLYDLRTGKSTSLGEGLALGWRPDGTAIVIRWPNARYRLIWGY